MSTDINATLGENMSSSQSNLTICVLNPRPVVLKMRSMKPNQAVHNVLFVVAFLLQWWKSQTTILNVITFVIMF